MRIRAFYIPLLILLGAAGFLLFHKTSKPLSIPNANVLLITIDTIRPDRLSPYGSSNPTPNLDNIARRGILFENAFCQAPLTFPSHTSILTGMFPANHGVHQNGLEIFQHPDFLITDLFRKNGYKTGAVVSSFVLDRRFGLASGFDMYEDRMERLPTISSNFEVERSGDKATDLAMKMLDSMSQSKWFLWIHYYDPHTPYAPPEPLSGYDGEVAFVDQQIGKLMSWLQSRKLDQNLIVVVMGDHGESLGEHSEQTHGFFVYNSTLKIPLVLTYPGAPQHRKYSGAVSAADVGPTLLQLTGIKDSTPRDGESMIPLINGNKRSREIYFESRYAELLGWNGLRGLIREDWKLIETTRSELYNWRTDGAEQTNLFTQNQSVSNSMKSSLGKLAETASGSSAEADPEALEKLRSLGYIGTTSIAKRDTSADPKDKIGIWAKYEKSLQLKNQNQPQDALAILEKLAEREPNNNFFRRSLATTYRELGRTAEAVEQLKTATTQNPLDADTYQELALSYKELSNYPEAMKAVDAAIALDPKRTEFHSLRGILLVDTARPEDAKSEFLQVLKIDPNNSVAWNNLGNAYRGTEQLDQAIDAYQQAVDIAPHYAFPLNGLATVLVRKNRVREAIPKFEKALALDPSYVEVYLNMAIAYHTLRDTEKAKTLYRTFLRLAPDSMQRDKEHARLLLEQIS